MNASYCHILLLSFGFIVLLTTNPVALTAVDLDIGVEAGDRIVVEVAEFEDSIYNTLGYTVQDHQDNFTAAKGEEFIVAIDSLPGDDHLGNVTFSKGGIEITKPNNYVGFGQFVIYNDWDWWTWDWWGEEPNADHIAIAFPNGTRVGRPYTVNQGEAEFKATFQGEYGDPAKTNSEPAEVGFVEYRYEIRYNKVNGFLSYFSQSYSEQYSNGTVFVVILALQATYLGWSGSSSAGISYLSFIVALGLSAIVLLISRRKRKNLQRHPDIAKN